MIDLAASACYTNSDAIARQAPGPGGMTDRLRITSWNHQIPCAYCAKEEHRNGTCGQATLSGGEIWSYGA
jgi:hypothetical protein